jgi:hypothetical protein
LDDVHVEKTKIRNHDAREKVSSLPGWRRTRERERERERALLGTTVHNRGSRAAHEQRERERKRELY